jgi:hypothetical protein
VAVVVADLDQHGLLVAVVAPANFYADQQLLLVE